MEKKIVRTREDSEKRFVPEKSGVSTADFSIIHYLELGESEALPGVTYGIGHDNKERGFLGHPGVHQSGWGSVETAALGVGWVLTPPQPPHYGSVLGL